MSESVEPLITTGDVAKIFKVDPKTVTRWARDGKLPYVTTLGGHRRYSERLIKSYLADHHVIRRGADEVPVALRVQ
jgi:excisionase family DNA binding protein